MDKKDITAKIKEALAQTTKRKFKQSAEISVNFQEINMEVAEYKLNIAVLLPKGRKKDLEVGVFADGDMNVKAKKISKFVLNKAEVEEYAKNKRKMRNYANSCYTFIAQPELMPLIGKTWGVVLGPRGKMPLPVPPNADLDAVTQKLKNTVRVRSKKNPTINVPVGSEDMAPEDLADNILAVMTVIERQIPQEKIGSIHFKTTMGKPVRLDA
jgi:large subunit ribosomal protein L1